MVNFEPQHFHQRFISLSLKDDLTLLFIIHTFVVQMMVFGITKLNKTLDMVKW